MRKVDLPAIAPRRFHDAGQCAEGNSERDDNFAGTTWEVDHGADFGVRDFRRLRLWPQWNQIYEAL